jgi:hypothetical protein
VFVLVFPLGSLPHAVITTNIAANVMESMPFLFLIESGRKLGIEIPPFYLSNETATTYNPLFFRRIVVINDIVLFQNIPQAIEINT